MRFTFFYQVRVAAQLTILVSTSLMLSGCAISRPCSEAGDVTWVNPGYPIKGDKKCRQVKNTEGKYVNDGKFQWFYMSGKLALEGEFKNGFKDGIWTQYEEKSGRPILEKNFVSGKEVLSPGAVDTDDTARTRTPKPKLPGRGR